MNSRIHKFDKIVITKIINDGIINIRDIVFIKEQHISQTDEYDGTDDEAIHICGYKDNKLIAYCRIKVVNGDAFIGRMCVLKENRKQGFGRELFVVALKISRQNVVRSISLNAQTHAQGFYVLFGFEPMGKTFLEAGIEHINMIKKMEVDMKKYFVNGGTKNGFGEETTKRLIKEGHKVYAVCDISDAENIANSSKMETELSKLIPRQLEIVKIDLTNKKKLVDTLLCFKEKIDGLINAWFYFPDYEYIKHYDYEQGNAIWWGNYELPKVMIIELMKNFNCNASIVLVTSTEGSRGSFGSFTYASSKAAIHNLIKSFACLLGDKAIRINAVAAGWIEGASFDKVFEKSTEYTPLKRMGKSTEVSGVINFLVSSDASFVNGTTIDVDGGYLGFDAMSNHEFKMNGDEKKK